MLFQRPPPHSDTQSPKAHEERPCCLLPCCFPLASGRRRNFCSSWPPHLDTPSPKAHKLRLCPSLLCCLSFALSRMKTCCCFVVAWSPLLPSGHPIAQGSQTAPLHLFALQPLVCVKQEAKYLLLCRLCFRQGFHGVAALSFGCPHRHTWTHYHPRPAYYTSAACCSAAFRCSRQGRTTQASPSRLSAPVMAMWHAFMHPTTEISRTAPLHLVATGGEGPHRLGFGTGPDRCGVQLGGGAGRLRQVRVVWEVWGKCGGRSGQGMGCVCDWRKGPHCLWGGENCGGCGARISSAFASHPPPLMKNPLIRSHAPAQVRSIKSGVTSQV